MYRLIGGCGPAVMTDTTTIEIPKAQRDRLRERATHDREPYYEVIERLLDGETDAGDTDTPDVADQLDRNYEAIKEATQAAQNAEQAVEEVTQR